MNKTILITGCSSGIGKAAAKLFAGKGWNVVATMRSPDKETGLTTSPNLMLSHLNAPGG
jgi:NAD(P)-dependent dehydrogenase (short-subunit alcohol dehydrogenase family)